MIDWLKIFKGIGTEIYKQFDRIYRSEEGKREIGTGAGGDATLVIDKKTEEVVLNHLKRIGDVRLISEESGLLDFGKPKVCVIADPVDGSFNASRGLELFATSLSLTELIPTYGNIKIGYIKNLVNGDEFYAIKGKGAYQNNIKIESSPSQKLRFMSVQFYPYTEESLNRSLKLMFRGERVRSLGSIAIELAMLANGTFDALIDLRKALRLMDIAAGKLILEEAGGIITDENGKPLNTRKIDLETRGGIIGTGNKKLHAKILKILEG